MVLGIQISPHSNVIYSDNLQSGFAPRKTTIERTSHACLGDRKKQNSPFASSPFCKQFQKRKFVLRTPPACRNDAWSGFRNWAWSREKCLCHTFIFTPSKIGIRCTNTWQSVYSEKRRGEARGPAPTGDGADCGQIKSPSRSIASWTPAAKTPSTVSISARVIMRGGSKRMTLGLFSV